MSAGPAAVELLFLWHHHQPDYRRALDGRSRLPWVRLHATKDYLDMALRVGRHARLRVTFNLVPSLLDQLDDVAAGVPDELFERLARPVASLAGAERAEVVWRCRMLPPWAIESWSRLRELLEATRDLGAVDDARLLALECWFLIAWLDPMFHDESEVRGALATTRFDASHRDALLALHARLAARVIETYRRLGESGRVELSASPYYHPILPLLVDSRAALRARPDLVVPIDPFRAPEDAALQVSRAIERHTRAFGARPRGMWPSEGSVSPEVAEIAARQGLAWLATDEGVLWRSLPEGDRKRAALYRPWRWETAAGPIALFFRDHELSDRIGFVYQRWDPRDAANDLIARVRQLGAEHAGEELPLVSVMLDGENCWEGYALDGAPFLDALYEGLEAATDIRTVTPSEVLAERSSVARLPALHTGSWIDADFHIWIGHAEKNRAWELVTRARRALVDAGRTLETHPAAWESLLRAEGSDWFWWFGEDHYTADKAVFDELFREHLRAVYESAGLPQPATLGLPIARPASDPITHLKPLGPLTPVIDGRRSHFYEWHAAGCVRVGAGGGSMHRAAGIATALHYGFDSERLYLRLDFAAGRRAEVIALRLELIEPRPLRIQIAELSPDTDAVLRLIGADAVEHPIEGAVCRVGEIAEIALPIASLGLIPGSTLELMVEVIGSAGVIESVPGEDLVRIMFPEAPEEASHWST
ncbi:MAG: glycoside hydrolase [Candidatus Eisenbacteria bacterium]|uniref:Glycoside hydrolase n=1 Tax=Eiseniibacteriota bacterium TaxID=2212470 RepID=A0A849SK25_UNCEI|nr:glycoside hydrolase [Candidatus Eisenbacteria bacterium]